MRRGSRFSLPTVSLFHPFCVSYLLPARWQKSPELDGGFQKRRLKYSRPHGPRNGRTATALLAKGWVRNSYRTINQTWRRTKWQTHAMISPPKTLKTQPVTQARGLLSRPRAWDKSRLRL